MPSRKRRVRRRRKGDAILISLIVIVLLAALVTGYIFIKSDPMGTRDSASQKLPAVTANPDAFVDQKQKSAPLVLGVTPTPKPEVYAKETQAPIEKPTSEPSEGANHLLPTPMPGEHFIPCGTQALRTPNDALMIAITIENCDDPEKMNSIISLARTYNAKITLFPTGDALMDERMGPAFKNCVDRLGHQIENKGFSKKAEHSLANGELAIKMWKQTMAMSYVMGGDFTFNFYRPASNDGLTDQRTHYYANILGAQMIVGYSCSYKDMKEEELNKVLFNGGIYNFDMRDKSIAMLEKFMEAANLKGYRMVTLNELFDLKKNARSDTLTIDQQELPDIEQYQPSYYDLHLNDRTYAVTKLQARLMQLGYMKGEDVRADGIYGPDTSIAVSAFQAKVGIPASGDANIETQEKLFSESAPNGWGG